MAIRELSPERSMPQPHRDLDLETANRFLTRQTAQQAGTIGRMTAEYEDLVDMLLRERATNAAMRAELADWRAWGAGWRD